MRAETIARNYAEALFSVGERDGQTERYAEVLESLAGAIAADPHIAIALDSPRVPKDTKADILARALSGHTTDTFIRFLRAVVKRNRQGLFGTIAQQYHALVDIKFNRVHAGVTMARMPNAEMQRAIADELSRALKQEVIPHFREDSSLLGGVLVRIGDRVMDGSVRRRMARLRKQMLG